MANRRTLKKDISYIAGDLFSEILICAKLIPGIEMEKAEALMTRVLDMHDEFIRRAHTPDGKENKARIKTYYKKLVNDFQTEVDAIVKEIEGLGSGKLA
ncbi:MAG: hypothetical protein LUG51_12600 [Tannerellaceae bacterium]|nr:hypothetical protein [Tannerellaceae bacterium]